MKEKNYTTRYNPEESNELDNIIRGSYDDFVRLERRNLLATSTLIVIVFHGGLNPETLSFFGASFSHLSASTLFLLLGLVCLYFLFAFSIYSYPGYRSANKKWKELTSETMTISGSVSWYALHKDNFISTTRFTIWLSFNYLLPIALGFYALLISVYKITQQAL